MLLTVLSYPLQLISVLSNLLQNLTISHFSTDITVVYTFITCLKYCSKGFPFLTKDGLLFNQSELLLNYLSIIPLKTSVTTSVLKPQPMDLTPSIKT